MNISKLLYFVAASVIISAAWGCKKANSEDQRGCGNMVKTWLGTTPSTGDSLFYSYSYDLQNRLISETLAGYYSATYAYGPGIVIMCLNGTDTTIFHLNAQGLEISSGAVDSIYYDTLGEKVLEIIGTDTFRYNWSNGDLISEIDPGPQGTTATTTYTYSTIIDNRNSGQPYLGKKSNHLEIQRIIAGQTINSSNAFDLCKRVNVVTQTSSTSPGPTISLYTYY